jgi:hypothetical protein
MDLRTPTVVNAGINTNVSQFGITFVVSSPCLAVGVRLYLAANDVVGTHYGYLATSAGILGKVTYVGTGSNNTVAVMFDGAIPLNVATTYTVWQDFELSGGYAWGAYSPTATLPTNRKVSAQLSVFGVTPAQSGAVPSTTNGNVVQVDIMLIDDTVPLASVTTSGATFAASATFATATTAALSTAAGLAASALFGTATTAALSTTSRFAASATFTTVTSATLGGSLPASFAAAATFSTVVTAALVTQTQFAAAATFGTAVSATLGTVNAAVLVANATFITATTASLAVAVKLAAAATLVTANTAALGVGVRLSAAAIASFVSSAALNVQPSFTPGPKNMVTVLVIPVPTTVNMQSTDVSVTTFPAQVTAITA